MIGRTYLKTPYSKHRAFCIMYQQYDWENFGSGYLFAFFLSSRFLYLF